MPGAGTSRSCSNSASSGGSGMAKRKRPPWGDILGKPIERLFPSEDEKNGRLAQQHAAAEQYQKMLRLKEHYGIEGESGWRPWYQLAVAIASELDEGLTIVNPLPQPSGKTARRWHGPEGQQLVTEIDVAKQEYIAAGKDITVLALLAEHQQMCPRYRQMTLQELERAYYRAKRYWTAK